jgi:hypothetical protein
MISPPNMVGPQFAPIKNQSRLEPQHCCGVQPFGNQQEPAMTFKFAPTIMILVAGLSLAACNKSTPDAQADAVRDTTAAAANSVDASADAVEKQGEVAADQADVKADAMRDNADAMKNTAETKADAIEAGDLGATTATDTTVTTTTPKK